jgi:hypothetical protein
LVRGQEVSVDVYFSEGIFMGESMMAFDFGKGAREREKDIMIWYGRSDLVSCVQILGSDVF